jgi:predicted metal-dependent hydrolase
MWIGRLHARPKVVRIQPLKRKWGSCSVRGVITLAADLADEPTSVQDAVIVHELLHLKIRNHGRLFKAMMSARVPNWRQIHRPACQVGNEDT